jgi:hypothetical protein
MLTIHNVRKDVGTTIGAYKLTDGGLSIPPYSGLGEYYTFHWQYQLAQYGITSNRTFKFLLDREPLNGKPAIYRFRLYDTDKKVVGTNQDGFIYETHVGKHLLNNRTDFYSFMIKTIEQYM